MKQSSVAIASMVTYLIYVVIWDGFTLGGCAYLVFWKGHSGWWFVLACIISGLGFQPHKWRRLWMPDSKETC